MKNKLIVIFGASGSGKSTLAQDIIKYFKKDNVVVISQDDYYLGCDKSSIKSFDEPEALDFDLLESNLIKLLNKEVIQSPIYNFKSHQREDTTNSIEPKNIVILDGTMVMTSRVIEKISNLTIYCDIELDISFIRRLSRDIKERGRDADSVINQYIEEVRPAFFKHIHFYKNKAHFNYNENNKEELFKRIKEIL